jgi:hypothetical protein
MLKNKKKMAFKLKILKVKRKIRDEKLFFEDYLSTNKYARLRRLSRVSVFKL